MSAATKQSRAQVWMDSLGDWSWPGQGGAVADALPPPWVPAFPPRHEPVFAPAPAPLGRTRRLIIGGLLSALVTVSGALALQDRLGVESLLGISTTAPLARAASVSRPAHPPLQPLPVLKPVSHDSAGSAIETAEYHSVALGHHGKFLVYLPSGYVPAHPHQRYPVLYLLHGNDQAAQAFLQIGLQEELDQLIAHHAVPPMIAVMIQGGRGANNWRNIGAMHYESYVLEVQELIDRVLPTIASRGARAIAGDSMGGYGAMNLALDNPYRFSVVESWLGFFNGLEGDLSIDRPAFTALGMHAFLYGATSDHIANPAENAPFAAALRGAGVHAESALYPGEHSLETIQAHLTSMLTFAGRALQSTQAHGAR